MEKQNVPRVHFDVHAFEDFFSLAHALRIRAGLIAGKNVIDASEPVRVGLRPFRARGVRLEVEEGETPIVHNYGHGGSGVTFSWGCAAEVVNLVESVVGG